MITCTCRQISDRTVETFLDQNPHMLGKSWEIVSTAISGKPPVCNNGKGICTDYATNLMDFHQKKQPCPQ